MGAYATAFPGGLPVNEANAAAIAQHWGFLPPHAPGMNAPEMIDAAHRGELDLLFSVGGNFLEVLPDPAFVEDSLREIPLRVHMDLVLSPQMFVEPKDTVLLLPAATRYETPGGVTETSTERRVIFSPEVSGRRVAEARPEWEVFLDLARRVRPDRASALSLKSTADARAEIARVVPMYDGIQHLAKQGDQFQYGGRHLCAGWHFPLPGGRAKFSATPLPSAAPHENLFTLTTRRGKQFNTMVHEDCDALTGAARDAILMNADDAVRLALHDKDPVRLVNDFGRYEGRIHLAAIRAGELQVHWPEGNVLLDRTRRAPQAGIPDYGASVRVEKLA